jgi:hypothetical protein
MTRHYAYTNAKLNSLLQQKGNETMLTTERTPLKINNLTVTANKVDNAAASNAIALSVWKEKTEMKKKKTMKEKEVEDALDYKERLELQRKITKINQLIPQVVDGYCNIRKIPDDYRSKVKAKVTRNYNGCILHRWIDHGLTQDEEKQFTPKPCDFNYAEKNIPESNEETEQHSTDNYLSFQSSDSIDSDDTSTKSISAENRATNADNKAIVSHTAEHNIKAASGNVNAIQNSHVSFSLVWT